MVETLEKLTTITIPMEKPSVVQEEVLSEVRLRGIEEFLKRKYLGKKETSVSKVIKDCLATTVLPRIEMEFGERLRVTPYDVAYWLQVGRGERNGIIMGIAEELARKHNLGRPQYLTRSMLPLVKAYWAARQKGEI